jgi:hypothetical protein
MRRRLSACAGRWMLTSAITSRGDSSMAGSTRRRSSHSRRSARINRSRSDGSRPSGSRTRPTSCARTGGAVSMSSPSRSIEGARNNCGRSISAGPRMGSWSHADRCGSPTSSPDLMPARGVIPRLCSRTIGLRAGWCARTSGAATTHLTSRHVICLRGVGLRRHSHAARQGQAQRLVAQKRSGHRRSSRRLTNIITALVQMVC